MKPQLVMQDLGGAHNANLEQTRARLIKGASWKKQRVIVVLPAGDSIPAKVALSHWNLIFPPNNGVVRILAQGMEVGEAYSAAIEQILAHPELSQWEYLLTIEHDNAPPQDGVVKLMAQMEAHPELAAISGSYYTKGEGGVLQAWGDPNDPQVNFRLRRPWFKTLAGKEGAATQDLFFWGDARKYGYRCAVDCAVTVGHYSLAEDIMW
jgi:hypothetical protein